MTLEMLKADVDAAAAKIGEAADGIRATDPASHLSGVAGALPGSQSASAAQALTDSWRTGVSQLAKDLDGQRERMTSAANHLQAQDEVVQQAFRRPMVGVM